MTITTLESLAPVVSPAVLYQEPDGLFDDHQTRWSLSVWKLVAPDRCIYARESDGYEAAIQHSPGLSYWSMVDEF